MPEVRLREVIRDHWCTPGCVDGCDIAKTRHWVSDEEVIERHSPLEQADIERMAANIRHVGRSW